MKKVFNLLIILCFIFITGCSSNKLNSKLESAKTITNLQFDIIYNEDAYVIEALVIDSVDIIISGSNSDINLFKTPEINLDLTNLSVSDSIQKVYFTCSNCSEKITYKIEPEYVDIKLKEKVSSVKIVDLKLINENKLADGIKIEKTELSHESVIIKGSEDTLDTVDKIKAVVDLSSINLSNTNYYVLNNTNLKAYDEFGEIISDVEIVPNKIAVMITVSKN